MKSVIPADEVRRGMFVVELDRPWLETPFLMQGFLVETDDQIATLQQFCQRVTIDRSRSLGSHFATRPTEKDTPRQSIPFERLNEVDEAGTSDFTSICRVLREQSACRRFPQPPQWRGKDNQTRLEAEMLYSAPIVEDVKRTLKSIHDAIGSDLGADLKQVGGLVSEMAQAVERNPDAMIWLTRLKSTDQYSYDHAVDVSVHVMVLGRFLGLPGEAVETLGLAGLMQDVGKVDIPAEILSKPGELTDEEYSKVQCHVASSLEMLVGKPGFSTAALDIVASHHERLDGSGYPRRLKGEKISLMAELAGLIDSYCAMTRQRSYHAAISSQKALEDLIRLRGKKFREPVVDQFVQCIGLYPIGTLVELNSGEVAVVIQQNQIRRLKPRVLVVLGPDKTVERHPRTLDLVMEPEFRASEPYRIVHSLPTDAYGIKPGDYYLE